jgi:serine/threonine protein kinase
VNPSRWRQINELFHAVLDRDPLSREQLLEAAGRDDPDLAREVRSLLASHDRTSADFLDRPAWGVAAELILDDAPSSLAGRQIGSYRIIEEIGRGGMGVVYAAEDQRLGRTVALKALPPEYTRDPVRRQRLTREARTAAALSHPAIATVFALEEIDGELYIVSELVRGRTLREELSAGPLPPERLLPTLIDIASALDAAHAGGIVHRDLKPENVVRRADGQIKVLDFGLARWEPTPDSPSMTRLTEAGVALGTPGYMAPEQLAGSGADARSDVFAFGVLAWELATGEHPFGTDPGSILARMTELMEGRPTSLSRPLPLPGLDRVARKCMRGSPDERYASAEALLKDLRSIAATIEAGSDATSQPVRDRSRAIWWWQFHQGTVAILDAATPVLIWISRQSMSDPARRSLGRWAFFIVLAAATAAVTLRLNLLFTSRVHPVALASQRSRLFRWIAIAEGIVAMMLVAVALMPGGASDAIAAALVSIAVVSIASLAIIEPGTTAAAGIERGDTEARS